VTRQRDGRKKCLLKKKKEKERKKGKKERKKGRKKGKEKKNISGAGDPYPSGMLLQMIIKPPVL
jgi:hypothetical protein